MITEPVYYSTDREVGIFPFSKFPSTRHLFCGTYCGPKLVLVIYPQHNLRKWLAVLWGRGSWKNEQWKGEGQRKRNSCRGSSGKRDKLGARKHIYFSVRGRRSLVPMLFFTFGKLGIQIPWFGRGLTGFGIAVDMLYVPIPVHWRGVCDIVSAQLTKKPPGSVSSSRGERQKRRKEDRKKLYPFLKFNPWDLQATKGWLHTRSPQ